MSVIVRIAAVAAALGGMAWIVKAGAILATGDQPPVVFETAPLLFAVGLLGVRAMLSPERTATRIGGFAASAAAMLGVASLAARAGSESSDGDFSPLVLATFLCTLAGLILLGLSARRRADFPWPVRVLPLLLGLLTFPLLAVGGALAVINERLLEVPLLVLGLAWILLGHSMWTSVPPSQDEATEGHPRRERPRWNVG